MRDAEIQAVANHVLRAQLGLFGSRRAEVRSGLDYSNEPAAYVDAVPGEGAPALGPTTLMDANLALSDALLAEGAERFSYLQTKRLGETFSRRRAARSPR